jgi:hypothetical protein
MSGKPTHRHPNYSQPPYYYRPRQTKLIVQNGFLSIQPLNLLPHHRTPAPHAVRRIANEAIFITNDASLTSLLRFPAEIRLVIYRLLLIYEGTIEYHICPIEKKLLTSSSRDNPKYPWQRHSLFPAILECCRIVHNEGTNVLYGENKFRANCHRLVWDYPAVQSRPLSNTAFESITNLVISLRFFPDLPSSLALFTNLQHLKVMYQGLLPEWESHLNELLPCLRSIPAIIIEITMGDVEIFKQLYSANKKPIPQAAAESVYRPPFEEKRKLWEGRKVKWEFKDNSDHYGIWWILYVLID